MYVDTSCSELPAGLPKLQRANGVGRIVFRRRDGATRLERLFQEGCAKIRLPRPLPGASAEAILINTAGGLTGGDQLSTSVELGAGATATVTTQACERIYRSTGAPAEVSARVRLGQGARLAWLPQETILFDGGRLRRTLEADLAEDAALLAVEAVLFGRQAMGETIAQGALHDRWRIRRCGRLVFADDLRFDGAIENALSRPAILGGGHTIATILSVAPELERKLKPVRDAIGEAGGASAWDGKLVARLVCADSLALRRRVESVLSILMGGRALPKVWQL